MRVGEEYELDKERQAATDVASAAWACELQAGIMAVEAGLSVWQKG